MHDLRFAVHYMYTHDSTVAGNHSSGNHVGYALMYSNNLEVHNNTSEGDRDRGLFLNFANESNISGNRIKKIGKDSYAIEKASVTSCDGDRPAWKGTGRNLNVTIEGYGTMTHAALWAKRIPVLYTPLLVFPVKLKRQSGLLPPSR